MTNFDSLVADFREPMLRKGVKLPYVLFGKSKYVREMKPVKGDDGRITYDSGGITTEKPRLFMLPLDSSHCHKEKIEQYASKGWPILKYWVPTTPEEKRPYEDAHAGSVNFGDDEKPGNDRFDQVLQAIRYHQGAGQGRVESSKREDELERRLREAEAKNKEREHERRIKADKSTLSASEARSNGEQQDAPRASENVKGRARSKRG